MKPLGLALLLACPVLAATEDCKARLKRWERLAKAPSPVARIEALRELEPPDDPGIGKALLDRVFLDEDFRVPTAAVTLLARAGTPELLAWFRSNGPARKDPRSRFYTLKLLTSLAEPASAGELKAFAEDEHWILRLGAATALASSPGPDAVALLARLLQDPAPAVRGAAVLGLADLGATGHLPGIRARLRDEDWRVRSSALEAVLRLKDLESLPVLRAQLEAETEMRLIEDLERVLGRLEEVRFEGKAEPGAEAVETRHAYQAIDYAPHRIRKTLQRRIVYVVDCSKSMGHRAVEEHAPSDSGKPGYEVGDGKRREREVSEVMGYDREDLRKKTRDPVPETKLGFAQREVCWALRKLEPETRFNVICFQSQGRQKAWQEGLVQATPDALAKAEQFVRSQQADGQTAPYDALVGAIGFQEHDLFKPGASWNPREWPDTVVIYSDGEPTEGTLVQDQPFLESIRRLYRISRARIHAVAVGSGTSLKLLESVAKDTGGRYAHIAWGR